jgi:hypothetical protein
VSTAIGMQCRTHRPRNRSASLTAGVVPFLRARWRPWRFRPPSLSSSCVVPPPAHAPASDVARPPNTPHTTAISRSLCRPTRRCRRLSSPRGPDAITSISAAPPLTLLARTTCGRLTCARSAAAHAPGAPPAMQTTSGAPLPLLLVGRRGGINGSVLCAGTKKGTDSLALDVAIF